MNLYLDSSSLLKLFLEEHASADVEALVLESSHCVTSIVAWPEACASLARARRASRLSDGEYLEALGDLGRFRDQNQLIGLSEQLAELAGSLAAKYFLRGLDSIHLASAVQFAERLRQAVSFSSFDDRLNRAAADCGLVVV